MYEELGPVMARSIVGDSYNPNYKYELATTEEGLSLYVTDKETGECNVIQLRDEGQQSPRYDPLYDNDRLESLRVRRNLSIRGFLLAASVVAFVSGLIALAFILVRAGVINGF